MKIHVWLNEREITREIAADLPLLEFVRSEGCYSVTRGCEPSNCGLCTVWKIVQKNLALISQNRAASSAASAIRDLS